MNGAAAARAPGGAAQVGRVLLLLAAAVACAGLTNVLRPRGAIRWVEDWGRYVEARAMKAGIVLAPLSEAVRAAGAKTRVLLDARPHHDYLAGHIPGALSLPYDDIASCFEPLQMKLTRAQPILTYCSGADCDEALLLTQYLMRQQFTNVVLFLGGFVEWERGGHPVARGDAP